MAVINCQIGCCIETFCSIQSSCVFEPPHTLAAVGGCYVGSASPPLPREVWQVRCARKPVFLISRARKRPIASTGRQGNCYSACRASTECAAVQTRNAVSQTDTHSETADASNASGLAEVCGPA